jgi:hypothetical protein
MSAVKKGLIVGFLAAALAGCDNSGAEEVAFSCEQDNRTATVINDGKNVTLTLKQKAAQTSDKPKDVYTSTQSSDKADALKRTATRYCMIGTVPR